VRLYLIDYRYRPKDQQFHKYQWIEISLSNRGAGNDKRKESRKPDLDSIKTLGAPLPTDHDWAARRTVIDKLPHHTLNEYKRLYDEQTVSLGVVRPKRILDLKVEDADPEWKPEWQGVLSQFRLFGEQPKPLTKIPYKFSYIFECEDSQTPHTAMCEDWELGVLYLKEEARLGSKEKAAESVRKKFMDDLCAPTKDTQFFMGTVFPYNTWVVLGVFYPPKPKQQDVAQLSLF
jgi:hypothetical protein